MIVVDLDGALLADSAGTDRLGTDYGDRPGDRQGARRRRRARTSATARRSDQEILATAVPVNERGEKVGVVRITQSVDAVSRATRRAIVGLAAIGLLVLAIGLAVGVVLARQIAGPLRRLDDAAARVAEGDLSVRAKVEGSAEQRSLARTFNGMTARLERLVAGQRDFVADASHQLRTPLSGLKLRLEEARAATHDPDVHEEVDAAMDELDRLAAIISELLVLSQAGEVDAPPEELDLDDAARRAAARWDGAEAGGWRRSRPRPALRPTAPIADLDRVLDALIENAPALRRRRRHGGRPRRAGWRCSTAGPGLAGEEVETVFERFHRGRAGRAGPAGTGLGLAIARELARRWGGDVELANRPDGGAPVARITVPARFPPLTPWLPWRMNRSALLWALAALAGVVLVAGVTYAASGLCTQAIGLSSEPLTAGDDLSPDATATPPPRGDAGPRRRPPPSRRPPPRRARRRARPARADAATRHRHRRSDRGPHRRADVDDDDNSGSDDDSGGKGRGRGRGGDDTRRRRLVEPGRRGH